MQVDGISIAKATAIENASVISGTINGTGHLILTTKGGTQIDAGLVVPNAPISATIAAYNAALTDQDFATIAGVETLVGKTLTSPTINGATVTAQNITSGPGQIQYLRQAADQTVTSSTAYVDTQLVLPVVDGGIYEINCNVVMNIASAGGGINLRAEWPGAGVLDYTKIPANYTGTVIAAGSVGITGNSALVDSYGAAYAGSPMAILRFLYNNTAGGNGNFKLRFAQATSSANACKIVTGSSLVARRII